RFCIWNFRRNGGSTHRTNQIVKLSSSESKTDGHGHVRSSNRFLLPLLVVLIAAWLVKTGADAYAATELREAYIPRLMALTKQHPTDGRLWSLLGGRLAQAGRYDEASDALERALAAGDNDPVVWLTLAGVEASRGRNIRTIAVLNVGIQKGIPGIQEAKDRIKNEHMPSGADPGLAMTPDGKFPVLAARAAGSFLNSPFEWWDRHNPQTSGFATRENWAGQEPDNPLAQRLWGEALMINGGFGKALPVLKHAVDLDPKSIEAHTALARLMERQSDPVGARREYAICLQLRPQWQPAVEGLARLQPAAAARFVDVTRGAGLKYQWSIPGKRPFNILQLVGNGCALLDYNNDGNLDILLVGPKLALFKGDGHGHFTDVTHEAGLDALSGHFLGCAVGDYDNDGFDDIYISAYRGGVLLHNEGGKRFRDVTQEAGIAAQPWGTSCAFADVDNDGKLDLFIGNYVQFGPTTQPQLCLAAGSIVGACGPDHYAPEHGRLYHNEDGHHFRDVTHEWGVDRATGKTLAVGFADYDDSHHESLACANDLVQGDLLHNNGHQFENVSTAAGTAFDSQGHANAGMGVDWGDYDNDGRLDLVVSSFQYETKCVYHNESGGLFADKSAALGITTKVAPYLDFGIKWIDYDNDGWLDLVIANGHVVDTINQVDKSVTYRQPAQLFHNLNGTSFVDVSAQSGSAFQNPIVGRGLAVGDIDNDGRTDVLIVDSEGSPLLLHNETPNTGHWLSLRLVGTKSNRDGIGALVTAEVGGLKLLCRCGTDGSYLSASDRRVHFGLGSETSVRTLTIRWPSGSVSTLHGVAADRVMTIKES
ncbi:MAG: FG-GAP-like repeat-containing protein, partial [Armatimonadota bacterium]|nr:FG-GAP-like repeat-containing protein [Armatimonadota bacterium]